MTIELGKCKQRVSLGIAEILTVLCHMLTGFHSLNILLCFLTTVLQCQSQPTQGYRR